MQLTFFSLPVAQENHLPVNIFERDFFACKREGSLQPSVVGGEPALFGTGVEGKERLVLVDVNDVLQEGAEFVVGQFFGHVIIHCSVGKYLDHGEGVHHRFQGKFVDFVEDEFGFGIQDGDIRFVVGARFRHVDAEVAAVNFEKFFLRKKVEKSADSVAANKFVCVCSLSHNNDVSVGVFDLVFGLFRKFEVFLKSGRGAYLIF